mgnify:CR=1 FL=1
MDSTLIIIISGIVGVAGGFILAKVMETFHLSSNDLMAMFPIYICGNVSFNIVKETLPRRMAMFPLYICGNVSW